MIYRFGLMFVPISFVLCHCSDPRGCWASLGQAGRRGPQAGRVWAYAHAATAMGSSALKYSLFQTPRMPSTKSEEEEIAELQALGINHPARRRFREREQRRKLEEKEKSWNATPFRTTPANLRGIKCTTKEPWSIDQKFYQKKTGSMEYDVNSQEGYDDTSVLAASAGYTSQVTASGLKGKLGGQPGWNSSTLRPVPHTLKGLKPVTREPWAVDAAINRDAALEDFSTFSAKVENDSVVGQRNWK